MDPLEASWLIRACAVLHNMCIDWGMQSLKPRDAHDPEIELKIQTEATNRFLRALRAARNRNGPHVKHLQRKRDDYIAGLNKRNPILQTYFGGPRVEPIIPKRWGCGRGRRRGRQTR